MSDVMQCFRCRPQSLNTFLPKCLWCKVWWRGVLYQIFPHLLALSIMIVLSGCATWDALKPYLPADPVAVTNPAPVMATYPIDLGSWSGRPAVTISGDTVHVVCDGGSGPLLAWWDIKAGTVIRHGVLNCRDWNGALAGVLNPSTVILGKYQLVTAWHFTPDVREGCVPFVYYRPLDGDKWKALECNPVTSDWQPCQLTPPARYWGMYNFYFDLVLQGDTLTLGAHGQYDSGCGGGGEKESRFDASTACNSGCKKTGGAWVHNGSQYLRWADYSRYPAMGNDDRGHSSVCRDGAGVVYLVAAWDGLVLQIIKDGKLLYPANDLPVIDREGWAGLYKTFLCITPDPKGGAICLYSASGQGRAAHIGQDGSVNVQDLAAGQIVAGAVDGSGAVHYVYGAGGHMWYGVAQ